VLAGHPGRDPYLFAIVLIAVLAVWIPPMVSSLWLDETGTFWVIDGSLGGVVERGLDFQGQFPLYHVALWGWSRIAGTSEVALRLPSLVGALVAAWLCYRLARRLFADAGVATLTACIFVLMAPVSVAAADARPYALALAALLGSTLALVRWLQAPRLRDAIAYVALTALTLYLHYLFGLALLAHVVIAAGPVRRMGRRGAVAALTAVAAVALLVLPSVPHFLEVIGRRDAMSLMTFGSLGELLTWVVPPALVVAYLAGRMSSASPDAPGWRGAVARGTLAFLVVWLVLPPLVLFVAGNLSGVGLYAERHFLSTLPALALLAALAFAPLSVRQRRIGIAVLAILFVLTSAGSHHRVWADWRGAARAVNELSDPASPVFVYAGFSESRDMDWVLDEERSRLFLAPLAAYPVEGLTHPLPLDLTDRAEDYVEGILATEAADADRFFLISAEVEHTYDTWLAERASSLGFARRELGGFGGVRVLVFER
jgi:mannosyltransferase